MKTNRIGQIVTALLLLVSGALPSFAHAEDWAYTGFYPYVYLFSSGGWIYVPDTAPLVYDYSAGDWAANPLGGRSFDIRDMFNQSPLAAVLTPSDGSCSMEVQFNWSGIDYAYFKEHETNPNFEYQADVYYRYVLNEKNGTCIMHGDFLDGSTYSFTLVLNFDDADSGTFTITGMFPFLCYTCEVANHVSTMEGTFEFGLPAVAD